MRRILGWVKENFWVVVIGLVALCLAGANFTPGTWLSGWDTLHPEFDFSLNIKRMVFGVWREEQGLGAVAGHSHMADLVRVIGLFIASLVVPANLLRYGFFFGCLVAGPIGAYYFIERTVLRERLGWERKAAAFAGAMMYLLNLGTVQHFYVPFEMFGVLFALAPWNFYWASRWVSEGGRRNLWWVVALTILMGPAAYAATLWYAYFGFVIIFVLGWAMWQRERGRALKRVGVVVLLMCVLNAYWILPQMYQTVAKGGEVAEAKINQMFSEKAFAHDRKYANLTDAAILRSFLFDWYRFERGEFVPLLLPWKEHLKNAGVVVIGYGLFGLVLGGAVESAWKRRRVGGALLPAFVVMFAFLAHGVFPLSLVFDLAREHLAIFKEGLRFPWTKFSIPVMLAYGVYGAYGVSWILEKTRERAVKIGVVAVMSGLMVIWVWPVFRGNLISKGMRVKIPEEYFGIYEWFKKQPAEGRIAVLPVPTMWGWEYQNWGFEGAGFLWFGLSQPLLVRDFDRWQRANENFYWEISYATYAERPELLRSVFEKYQVEWVVVDEKMINPAWPFGVRTEEVERVLWEVEGVKLEASFGTIKVYRVELEVPMRDFVFVARDLPVVGPEYEWNNYDKAYEQTGNYISGLGLGSLELGTRSVDYFYPFRSLFTGRKQEEIEFELEDRGDVWLFRKTLAAEIKGYRLELGEFDDRELVEADPGNLGNLRYVIPAVFYDGDSVEVRVPKVKGYFAAEINPASEEAWGEVGSCNRELMEQFGKGERKWEREGERVRLESKDSTTCAAFWLPNLAHTSAYLISTETKHVAGKSLLFWVENLNARRADLETYLPKTANGKWLMANSNISYFIQPPMEEDGMGYSLHFDNNSIGGEKSVNELGKVTVSPIPYRFLTSLRLERRFGEEQSQTNYEAVEVEHPNPSLYIANSKWQMANGEGQMADGKNTLVLSQAYDEGWKTYRVVGGKWSVVSWLLAPIWGEEIKEHVKVNNWENGWKLDSSGLSTSSSQKIVIVYLPQYLEYAGLVMFLAAVVGVALWPVRRRQD